MAKEQFSVVDDKELLAKTNLLLSHVGISAKQIISMKELVRVASSMFVAVFEALFRTRLEGIIRNPKGAQDYISNCQTIIDGLAHHLQMDLRHITGDSIFRGDKRSLLNLLNILLRISNITVSKDPDEPGLDDVGFVGRDSTSISTHDSTFPTDPPFLSLSEIKDSPRSGHIGHDMGELHYHHEPVHSARDYGGPDMGADSREQIWETTVSPRLIFKNGESAGGIDVGALRRSLSEFEQHKKMETARQRREYHLRMKVNQSIIRNQRKMDKTCKILQQQWTEDMRRADYSQMLRTSHEENIMLRKIQCGMIKQMCLDRNLQNEEMKTKIEDLKKQARNHFESLQNLYEDRVHMLRESEQVSQIRSEADLRNYRDLMHDLQQARQVKKRNTMEKRESVTRQKQTHRAVLRKESHHQLLDMLAMSESWEDSLRAAPPRPVAPKRRSPVNSTKKGSKKTASGQQRRQRSRSAGAHRARPGAAYRNSASAVHSGRYGFEM